MSAAAATQVAKKARASSASSETPPERKTLSNEDIYKIREALDGGPTQQELAIHAAVCEQGQSQREVAKKCGLSQPRICQILKKVDEWTMRLSEDRRAGYTPTERRRLAEHTFRRRLDYFYSQAMAAWRASKGNHTETRSSDFVCGGKITRPCQGKPTYLMLAMRIAEKTAQIDWVPMGGGRHFDAFDEAEASEATAPQTSLPAVEASQAENPHAAPEPVAPAVPEVVAAEASEDRLSRPAEDKRTHRTQAAPQVTTSSRDSEKSGAANRPPKPRGQRVKPLITPTMDFERSIEREALYRQLEQTLVGLRSPHAPREGNEATAG